MLVIIVSALIFAAGFGVGRIKNLEHAEAKAKADVAAVKAEAKKL